MPIGLRTRIAHLPSARKFVWMVSSLPRSFSAIDGPLRRGMYSTAERASWNAGGREGGQRQAGQRWHEAR